MGFRSGDLLDQTPNRRLGSGSNPVLKVREPDRGQSSDLHKRLGQSKSNAHCCNREWSSDCDSVRPGSRDSGQGKWMDKRIRYTTANVHLSACRGEGRKSDTPGLVAAV